MAATYTEPKIRFLLDNRVTAAEEDFLRIFPFEQWAEMLSLDRDSRALMDELFPKVGA